MLTVGFWIYRCVRGEVHRTGNFPWVGGAWWEVVSPEMVPAEVREHYLGQLKVRGA